MSNDSPFLSVSHFVVTMYTVKLLLSGSSSIYICTYSCNIIQLFFLRNIDVSFHKIFSSIFHSPATS